MAKKKRLLSKVGSGVKRLHREAFRIIEQGLGICNKALEKTGIDKVLGGGSIGASTSYGSNGGHNVHYTPSNSSTSIGFGVSNNNGAPSLFVNNQATIVLTTPPAKFAIQSVEDRIAERDQLLREINGPGYIPESSLATIGMVAIGHAATQFVNDTVEFVNIVSDVHADTWASIYNINDSERSEALSRNMDRTTNVAQSILKAAYNPSIITVYYENHAQDAADKFSAAYGAGDLIGAGVATGQTFYDIGNAAALTTGVVNFTAKAATKVGKSVNNFVAANDFRPPIAFQFDYARLNNGIPVDSVKLQNPVVGKAADISLETKSCLAKPKLTKQKILNYLEGIHDVPREQLIKDIESIGFKYAGGSPDKKIVKFVHKTKHYRIEIHEAHLKRPNGAKYDHIHIRDRYGNSLDKNLNIVDSNSLEAHIEIKPLDSLTMEGKLKLTK